MDDSPIKYIYIYGHAGAGTKAALAYLYWKETGDMSVWRGIAQVRLNFYIISSGDIPSPVSTHTYH